MDKKERVQVESRSQWRQWLADNHAQKEGVWLVRFKKLAGEKHLTYDEAVEEAICFGWVDSLPRKLDKDRSMLYMSPRKPGSSWSRVNKERVERMLAAGRITPAGMTKIEAAKKDGSWTALDDIENLEIPDDLGAALDSYPSARKNFDAFPRSVKRGILEWIATAKREATRAKRVTETARLADDNIRANQWPRKK